MKKLAGIVIKSLLGLILLILILLFTIPVIFKEKIKTKVEAAINESVNARVTFSDYSLSFFRNFPNLSFSLKELSVAGIEKFEGDTLAGFKSFSLVFNLGSIFGKSGYEIKSIVVDKAVVNAIVLKDGTPNWDIAKPSEDTAQADSTYNQSPESESSGSSMKIQLKRFEIKNSSVSYNDESMNMKASLKDLNYMLSGNMTLSETNLDMGLKIAEANVTMDGVNYLTHAVIDSKISLLANLDSMKFSFGENYFSVNDLKLNFSGDVAMPGDNIKTDVSFGTSQTSFKTLLSLVPAVYMSGYEDLKASGEFSLSGSARGIYSEADSTLPDISINLTVNDGLVSYPDLPEKISAININTKVAVDGKDLDRTTVTVDKFHFELAGSPFDASFFLKTPISDPDFRAAFNGKLDLSALSKAVPLDSIEVSGILEMALTMAGSLSMIEKEQYERFSAKGSLSIKNILVEMAGYPSVEIKDANFLFTPAYTRMERALITVAGKSDFLLSGNIENYIPYVFRNETIRGRLSLNSELVDLTSIMNSMAEDTSAVAESTDTASLTVVSVPKNIDFDFNALIKRFSYDNIQAQNVKGHLVVKDGVLTLKETGLEILGGSVLLNAEYDTRDTLKPLMKTDLNINNMGVKEAFNTFVIVQKFAPAAKGIDGKVNAQLKYESLLGSDMMPVLNTIEGYGKLQSNEIQLLESATFDKMKDILKLGDKYSNRFKDINVSFKISKGRIYADPFNVKVGNIKMNIAGDQGLDQTINYLVKTEIPRSELGSSVNSLIDNLSSQASAFGLAFKPSDVLKVNVRVKGTFTNPEVSPDFGGGSGSGATSGVKETVKATVKETVNQTVDKTKDQLREEAAQQGDKLIKEAEERGQQLREEAARAAARIKQEADSSAARLIKTAEPKGMIAKTAAQKGADALKREADKRSAQIITEADNQAKKLLEEARTRKEEMIEKL